jgi:hypothetical protein
MLPYSRDPSALFMIDYLPSVEDKKLRKSVTVRDRIYRLRVSDAQDLWECDIL